MARKKVILDVDTGVDDALALLYALHSDELDVLGITTCFGNVDIETATHNTLAIVELSGRDIPVYQGASKPLLRDWDGPVPWIHGENGLGDAKLPNVTKQVEPEEAASFIRRTILQHPGEVTLIPVARMTNVAKALMYDGNLVSQLAGIVMMGGAAFCPGNVTPVAEANIWGDPEAADIVFTSGAPITMVGLDVTMKAAIRKHHLDGMDPSRPYTRLVQDAVAFYMHCYEDTQGAEALWCPLHDPLAVAVAEDASLCKTLPYHVRVETQGRFTSGMTVVDARKAPDAKPNARVCVDINAPLFEERFCTRLGMTGDKSE